MTDIIALIERDRSRRIVGIGGVEHLIEYKDMTDYKFNFDGSLPHIKSSFRRQLVNLSEIKKEIKKAFPYNFNFDNLLIAGGMISSLISGDIRFVEQSKDIDIFIYGLNEEQANKKLEEIIHTLRNPVRAPPLIEQNIKKFIESMTLEEMKKKLEEVLKNPNAYRDTTQNTETVDHFYSKHRKSEYKYLWRNTNVVTIGKYQIILRCYTSISEILHGFDLPSCAVGFDGDKIRMTEMAVFAFQTGFNVLDLTRRSTSYEYRLRKYFNRGFGIIFPGLKLASLEVGKSISKVVSFEFIGLVEEGKNEIYINFGKSKQVSDYEGDQNMCYKIPYLNLYKILKHEEPTYYYGMDLKTCVELVNKETINSMYYRLIDDFKQDFFDRKRLTRYLPETPFANIIEMKLSEFKQIVEDKKKYLFSAIEEHKKKNIGIKWRVDNPGSQLVGSFNPSVLTEEEWYNN